MEKLTNCTSSVAKKKRHKKQTIWCTLEPNLITVLFKTGFLRFPFPFVSRCFLCLSVVFAPCSSFVYFPNQFNLVDLLLLVPFSCKESNLVNLAYLFIYLFIFVNCFLARLVSLSLFPWSYFDNKYFLLQLLWTSASAYGSRLCSTHDRHGP